LENELIPLFFSISAIFAELGLGRFFLLIGNDLVLKLIYLFLKDLHELFDAATFIFAGQSFG
jgi:hypothetical protein